MIAVGAIVGAAMGVEATGAEGEQAPPTKIKIHPTLRIFLMGLSSRIGLPTLIA
jgi:hypothetical protein